MRLRGVRVSARVVQLQFATSRYLVVTSSRDSRHARRHLFLARRRALESVAAFGRPGDPVLCPTVIALSSHNGWSTACDSLVGVRVTPGIAQRLTVGSAKDLLQEKRHSWQQLVKVHCGGLSRHAGATVAVQLLPRSLPLDALQRPLLAECSRPLRRYFLACTVTCLESPTLSSCGGGCPPISGPDASSPTQAGAGIRLGLSVGAAAGGLCTATESRSAGRSRQVEPAPAPLCGVAHGTVSASAAQVQLHC